MRARHGEVLDRDPAIARRTRSSEVRDLVPAQDRAKHDVAEPALRHVHDLGEHDVGTQRLLGAQVLLDTPQHLRVPVAEAPEQDRPRRAADAGGDDAVVAGGERLGRCGRQLGHDGEGVGERLAVRRRHRLEIGRTEDDLVVAAAERGRDARGQVPPTRAQRGGGLGGRRLDHDPVEERRGLGARVAAEREPHLLVERQGERHLARLPALPHRVPEAAQVVLDPRAGQAVEDVDGPQDLVRDRARERRARGRLGHVDLEEAGQLDPRGQRLELRGHRPVGFDVPAHAARVDGVDGGADLRQRRGRVRSRGHGAQLIDQVGQRLPPRDRRRQVRDQDLAGAQLGDVCLRVVARDLGIRGQDGRDQLVRRGAGGGALEDELQRAVEVDRDQMIGADAVGQPRLGVAQPPARYIQARVRPEGQRCPHRRILLEDATQTVQVVAVQTGVALIASARRDRQIGGLADRARRAAREQPERRGPPRHAIEVADQGALDLQAALARRLLLPDGQRVEGARRGDEQRLTHLGPAHDRAQARPERRRVASVAGGEGLELVGGQERRAHHEEARGHMGRLGSRHRQMPSITIEKVLPLPSRPARLRYSASSRFSTRNDPRRSRRSCAQNDASTSE